MSVGLKPLLLLSVLALGQAASADKLGIIGDSLSTAMDANDDCDSVSDCLRQIGEDRDYSFVGGEQPWSLNRRLAVDGIDDIEDQASNGARWRDAPAQAERVMVDDEVTQVIIELGGNDVCRGVNESPPDLDTIADHIDQTLTLLSDRLPAGGTIILAEVPDVVQLYQRVRERPHFIFEDCQALWDLDSGRLNDEALGEFGASVVERFESIFTERFGGEFSCGNVLNSATSDAERDAVRRYNRELNALLASKAAEYQGRKGIAIRFVDNVYDVRFDASDISALDCFHPSRQGQQVLAERIWQDLQGAPVTLFDNGFE